MQSVSITTNVVSSNPVHGEVYSIQHYVVNFVSDLRQVGGFLWVLRFPPLNKTPLTKPNQLQCSLGLSPPPRFIANLAYRQNSRLSRFPPLKIPCYTAKLSYRHPLQVFRHKSRKTNLNSPVSTAHNYLLT